MSDVENLGLGDNLVDDLRGNEIEQEVEQDGDGFEDSGEDEIVLDPRFESVAELIEKFDKTKTISAKTAKNLTKERAENKRLREELAALKEGRDPVDTRSYEPEDEQVKYKPEGEPNQMFYDENVFQRLMETNDPNWETMKTDEVYTGQARAIMKAMMTAIGNIGVEIQGMRRESQMASVGVTQQEVEQFLSIPQFSHLRGLPFEQIADVLSGIRELQGGSRPKPAAQKGDGAQKTVRRDPTALGASTANVHGKGTANPADAINAALDQNDRAAARKIAAGLFFRDW